jgi:predicted RNase H-like HicB family nuclease
MYRIGLPFWKTAARAGLPLSFRVRVVRDDETNSFWAESPDLDGLVVSGQTLEELRTEVLSAAQGLLELEVGSAPRKTVANLQIPLPCAA